MDMATYQKIPDVQKIKQTSAKLKPSDLPPIPILGYARLKLAANEQTIETKFFITVRTTRIPILGKYMALDLNILHINIQNLVKDLSSTPKTGHLSYNEMHSRLTPVRKAEKFVESLYKDLR